MTDANQFEHFFDEGLIEAVLRPIKSGKEASVHLCRANPRTTGEELVALKAYHPLDRRDFRDESMYRDGEWIKPRRVRVALEQKTRFGREVQGMIWVDREWDTLRALSAGGAPVPRPIERTGDAILMSYVGDETFAAPQLRSYPVDDADEAEAIVDQVLRAIERMLFLNVVHGDLSPYNLLVWEGRGHGDRPSRRPSTRGRTATRRTSSTATSSASARGARTTTCTGRPARIANDLWTGWEIADLVPEELRGLTM